MNGFGQFLVGGGLTGLVLGVINFLLTRPKVKAEAAKTATEAAGLVQGQLRELIKDLNERIDDQEERITALEKERRELRLDNDRLGSLNTRLREAFLKLSAWVRRYYDAENPPPGIEAPPRFDNDPDLKELR